MKKSLFAQGLFLLFFHLVAVQLNAQTEYYFYVQLTDKNGTSYSLDIPTEFLSQRAIDRREFFGILCDSTDLPVNEAYLEEIKAKGAKIYATTKWLNGVTVAMTDSNAVMSQIRPLSFVSYTQYTGQSTTPQALVQKKLEEATGLEYGNAQEQVSQIKVDYLHTSGYQGEGIHIAVIDAGYTGANTIDAFKNLRDEGRLLGTKDFVNPANPSDAIFGHDGHGTNVLSTMAGYIPGSYVGTAPKASYWLLRTEKSQGEYLFEPDLWISAAEYADSAGVDVMTTSLGYSSGFSDASMNIPSEKLDGETIRCSIAAGIAAKKGIVVLNSAGNSGISGIGSPADAKGIITVGSVTSTGAMSGFSSYGPSADGRIKPELCARGTLASIIASSGVITNGNGTSYATPILAGAMACYLQAAKENNIPFSINTLLQAVFETGTTYAAPTGQGGYGIPNFEQAYDNLFTLTKDFEKKANLQFTVQAFVGEISITTELPVKTFRVSVYSSQGNLLLSEQFDKKEIRINTSGFSKGVVFVNVESEENTETTKLIITD